ncbi:MAG: hypothetical protein ACLSAH_13205 [Bilophila wadsworthia]
MPLRSPATPASLSPDGRACRRSGAAVSGGVTPAEIERIVDAALDAKLSPIKRACGAGKPVEPPGHHRGHRLIFGLIGVAAYFRRQLVLTNLAHGLFGARRRPRFRLVAAFGAPCA